MVNIYSNLLNPLEMFNQALPRTSWFTQKDFINLQICQKNDSDAFHLYRYWRLA